ncbi:hypothetical protein SAMD00019534_031290 [Acytostelium subglobosum LB1]|uniref:hypothetical protein n=1 Tax=Acytostelium subglobosum LB1 TaxID=1410327 RepID=UPI0006450D21|nr:hypothetical protein SAMD00019534_031290 [Acytostelium subglobosum LB1]GAM19954.1 hypothetical protein SAMD00019534_031290 [Acytostelium subglobosum LB1]|eukprot:XP_012756716.1 hypothetical protein SAMD00019534_031290 [Acytostelium subglobosum LB1]
MFRYNGSYVDVCNYCDLDPRYTSPPASSSSSKVPSYIFYVIPIVAIFVIAVAASLYRALMTQQSVAPSFGNGYDYQPNQLQGMPAAYPGAYPQPGGVYPPGTYGAPAYPYAQPPAIASAPPIQQAPY